MDLAALLASIMGEKGSPAPAAPSADAPQPFGMAAPTAQNDPGFLEMMVRALHDGRDLGHRSFYNQTRAGLYNSATAPDEGRTYGGVGHGLNTRRALQGYDAQAIEDAILGHLRGGR